MFSLPEAWVWDFWPVGDGQKYQPSLALTPTETLGNPNLFVLSRGQPDIFQRDRQVPPERTTRDTRTAELDQLGVQRRRARELCHSLPH